MVYSKITESGVQVGTMYNFAYPSGGTVVGAVVDRESARCDCTDYSSQAAYAMAKRNELGYTNQRFNEAVEHLNNGVESDLERFNDDIAFLDEVIGWFWGSVETGGVGVWYPMIEESPNIVAIIYSTGLYSNGEYYRYYVGGGMEPYRTPAQLSNTVVAYNLDGGIHVICADRPVRMNMYMYTQVPAYDGYVDAGYGTLQQINESRQTLTTLLPPFYAHAVAFDLNSEGCEGGFNDSAAIYNDELSSPYDQTWQHIAGHWYGADSLQPSPSRQDKEQGDWEEEDYSPSEDDRNETTDDQFDIDAINSGLITIFNPTMEDVRQFSKFLFSGITEDIAAFFKRLLTTPLDYIITMSLVHYKPNVNGAAEIKFGGIGSGVASMVVEKQMQKLDFGTITIPAQYGGFLDQSGFTKIKIYLPYCGKHDIDVDLSMGADIHLVYWVDNLSGACIAQLVYNKGRRYPDDRSQSGQVYEFTGNVFEELPLSAADYRSVIQGALTAAAGVGSFVAGNPISGAGAIASGVMSMKPNISHTGKVGSNFGYMGSQYAYIEVYRPTPAEPPDYDTFEGYNAAWSYKLSELSGFTKVRKDGIKLKDLPYITEEEIKELHNIFEEGVIL